MVKKDITGQNSLRRKRMLRQPLLFDWLPEHSVFWFTPYSHKVSQATFGYLLLTMQHLCDLRDAMPRHWSLSASHPTPYLGKQRISLGVAIILSMYRCQTVDIFACCENFDKRHRAADTLISSHESRNWNNCSLKKCIAKHGCLKIPTINY